MSEIAEAKNRGISLTNGFLFGNFFFRFLLDPKFCKRNLTFLFPNSKKSFPLAPALTKSCAHMTDGQLRWRCIWRLKAFYILPQTVKLSVNTRLTTRWLVDKSPAFWLSRKRLNNVGFSTFGNRDGNIACISVSSWIWRCWNFESFAYFQLVSNA